MNTSFNAASGAATSSELAGPRPNLRVHRKGGDGAALAGMVVLLHGGREKSREPVRAWNPALARMRLFIRPLLDRGAPHGVGVALIRDRYQGWNGDAADPVDDAQWALDEVAERHGPVPVVLVGHSMGARAALRAAGHPSVVAVAALAPWVPPGEPVTQLAGRTVLLAYADRDRIISPAQSFEYARRARELNDRVARLRIDGGNHGMLRRFPDWQNLAIGFALGALGVAELPDPVSRALGAPSPQGLDMPFGTGGAT